MKKLALTLALALASLLAASQDIINPPGIPFNVQTLTQNGVLFGNGSNPIGATAAASQIGVLCFSAANVAPAPCAIPSVNQLNGVTTQSSLILLSANTGNPIIFQTGPAVSVREAMRVADFGAGTVNYLNVYGRSTGLNPIITVNGTDAAIGLGLSSKSTSPIQFFTAGAFTGDILTTANEQVRITDTATPTRALTLTGSNGGNPTVGATAGGVAITGTVTNDSAAAGQYGEFVTANAAPAAVALTTNTSANVTSVSLTAGDWDCTGTINFTFGATTSVTNLTGGASIVSATLPAQDLRFDNETAAQVPTATAVAAYPVPTARELLAGTTTVFLVAQATFTVSTLSAGGTLRCRRMR